MAKEKRGNGEGCLHVRGNYFWARWMYHGEVYDKSTKVRVDMVDVKGRPCGREIAEKVLETLTEPFKHRAEADTLSLIQNRIEQHALQEEETNTTYSILKLSDIGEAFERSTRRNDIVETHLASYKACANEFARWAGESRLARQVTPRMAVEWANKIWSDNLTPHTFNGKISTMRQIWNVLQPELGFKENPWNGIKKKKRDGLAREVLTDNEIESICSVAGNAYGGDARDLVIIGANTGMRISDCATLKWSDVFLEDGIIRKTMVKTGREVSIPILPELNRMLSERRERLVRQYEEARESGTWKEYWLSLPAKNAKERISNVVDERFVDYVFPRMAERYLRESPGKTTKSGRTLPSILMRKIFTKAGITTSVKCERGIRKRPVKTFHSLRATFVTKLAEAGVPQRVAMEIVGHRSAEISEHYTHVSEDYLKREMRKIGK